MNKRQNYTRREKMAAFLAITGSVLALGAAGSDDAREFATEQERAHLNIPKPAVTYTMFGVAALSWAAAIALMSKNSKDKQR